MIVEKYQNIPDSELLQNFYQDHNNQWLGILFPRYTLLLIGVCMKYLKNEEDARDSVQQIFLKALTELHKYKVEYFKSWIYMVAKNHCLMKLRDQEGKFTTDLTEKVSAAMSEEQHEERLKHLETDRTLELMGISLNELSDEQKRCVTLFYLERKSYQDIAELTGFSLMKVKSCIQNGKRNLRILVLKKLKENKKV